MFEKLKANILFSQLLKRPNIDKAYAMVGPEDSWYDTITKVHDSLAQIRKLHTAGCQIARLAVPNMEAARAFAEICKESPLPLVADIHLLDIPGACWGALHAEQKEFGNNVL